MNLIKSLFRQRLFYLSKILFSKNEITFLMLHGVVDYSYDNGYKTLRHQTSCDDFDRGVSRLSRFFNFISMQSAVDMLSGVKPIEGNCAVLTFDDGYRNNITHALPILVRHSLPAVFFVSTGFVDDRLPYWYDRLDFAIQHLKDEQSVEFDGCSFLFKPNDFSSSKSSFAHLRYLIKKSREPYSKTIDKVSKLSDILEKNACSSILDEFETNHFSSIMSWEEARGASTQGISIGSHSVTHPILDKIDKGSVMTEMVESKAIIESQVGQDCVSFCYPNGNWNQDIAKMVKEAGYEHAITTDKGGNRVGEDVYSISRFSFPEAI